jgi:ankyrin repeat protein
LVKPSKAPAPTVVVQPAAPPIVPRVDPPLTQKPIKPSVGQAFLDALRDGDLAGMEKHYEKDMRLDGTLGTGAATGKKDVVEWLVAHGADIHEAETDLEAPILAADAYPEVVKLLLAKGAKEPKLQAAVAAGAVNAVDRLIASGQSPKAVENGGQGALLVAAIDSTATPAKRQLVLDKLLAAGADPNAHDASVAPLTSAVSRCDAEEGRDAPCKKMIQSLIAKGARADQTTLQAVVDLGDDAMRVAIMDAVLAAKLEPSAATNIMSSLSGERDAWIVKKLAPKGVQWSGTDADGEQVTPFLDAVERGDAAIAKAMIDAGAPATQRTKDGRTALGLAIDHLADEASSGAMVDLLLAHGASAQKRLGDGRTPLFAAAEAGNLRVVNALLAHGARVNEVVLDETALDAAERSGNTAVARVLHAHGGRRHS